MSNHAKEAMIDNIKQELIELIADFLDNESVKLDESLAGIADPVPRDESELHIRMANAAFNEYKKTMINQQNINSNENSNEICKKTGYCRGNTV